MRTGPQVERGGGGEIGQPRSQGSLRLSESSVTVGEKKGRGKNYQMNDDVTSSEFDRYNYVINRY